MLLKLAGTKYRELVRKLMPETDEAIFGGRDYTELSPVGNGSQQHGSNKTHNELRHVLDDRYWTQLHPFLRVILIRHITCRIVYRKKQLCFRNWLG